MISRFTITIIEFIKAHPYSNSAPYAKFSHLMLKYIYYKTDNKPGYR